VVVRTVVRYDGPAKVQTHSLRLYVASVPSGSRVCEKLFQTSLGASATAASGGSVSTTD
jgi:hypothetical protein